ncbi:MAG: hypothetical protein JWM68_2580 [Verrucomicrobiales bacterium]|nr:hypothetical protein [Verrucomicrobiales bacterium]
MQSGEIILKLIGVAVLIFLNGFFVAAEFALVKIRDTQLEPLSKKGSARAKAARYVISHLDRFLSAAQLGITLASLALGWIGEPVFAALLHPALASMHMPENWQHYTSFAVGFSVLTFLHIVTGEQAPKMMAIQKPLPTALWVAYPLIWFYKISFPFIWILNHSSQWMLRQMGIESLNEGELVHSEEELRLMFATSQKHFEHSSLSRDVVLNALDLRQRIVREVMRPRQEIVYFSTEHSIAECLDIAEKSRYSRFPLCEGEDLDKTLGVVHIKDLYAMRLKAITARDLMPGARKIIYVPETARLEKLLQLFLERKLHFAIVVDEYGTTVGLVSLENILEELVGQIQDEFDQEKPLLVKRDEMTWDIDGALPLHELSELIGEPLAEEGITTTSGFVTHRLGGFPKAGDVLVLGNNELRVEAMSGPRVARLKLQKKEEANPAS